MFFRQNCDGAGFVFIIYLNHFEKKGKIWSLIIGSRVSPFHYNCDLFSVNSDIEYLSCNGNTIFHMYG